MQDIGFSLLEKYESRGEEMEIVFNVNSSLRMV